MKTQDTPPAKSALFKAPLVNADIADNAGGLSGKINEAKAVALALTDKLCEVSMALGESGYAGRSARAMRQYLRATDLYLSVERNLEGLS